MPCEPEQQVWELLVGCCNSCRGDGFSIILPCLIYERQTEQPTPLYLRLDHSVLTVATVARQYRSFITDKSCSGRWCRLLSVLRTAQPGGVLGPWVPRDHFLGMSSIHPSICFCLHELGFWWQQGSGVFQASSLPAPPEGPWGVPFPAGICNPSSKSWA